MTYAIDTAITLNNYRIERGMTGDYVVRANGSTFIRSFATLKAANAYVAKKQQRTSIFDN